MNRIPKWAAMKGTYALVAVVLAVLGGIGVLTETEVNTISGQIGDLVMILGGIIAGVASGRTGPDSGDDRPLIVIDPDSIAEEIETRLPDVAEHVGTVVIDPIEEARRHVEATAPAAGTLLDEVRRRINEGR